MSERPSINDLEASIMRDDGVSIEILPDGTIVQREGDPVKAPLTFREYIPSNY